MQYNVVPWWVILLQHFAYRRDRHRVSLKAQPSRLYDPHVCVGWDCLAAAANDNLRIRTFQSYINLSHGQMIYIISSGSNHISCGISPTMLRFATKAHSAIHSSGGWADSTIACSRGKSSVYRAEILMFELNLILLLILEQVKAASVFRCIAHCQQHRWCHLATKASGSEFVWWHDAPMMMAKSQTAGVLARNNNQLTA